jgi:5-methylcytosine-specific restriction endonuclease McrA
MRLTAKFHYDHIVPDGLGGEPVLENCAVLCWPCHADKTAAQDVPQIAKAKRQHVKAIGAKPPSRNPLPGSKNSKWKKKMDGTVVLR